MYSRSASEIGRKSSFIVASSSPSFLLFSIRQFSAFAEHQRLSQGIFVGILAGLRTFSVLAEVASGPRR
jgi:hypothetical protein